MISLSSQSALVAAPDLHIIDVKADYVATTDTFFLKVKVENTGDAPADSNAASNVVPQESA